MIEQLINYFTEEVPAQRQFVDKLRDWYNERDSVEFQICCIEDCPRDVARLALQQVDMKHWGCLIIPYPEPEEGGL